MTLGEQSPVYDSNHNFANFMFRLNCRLPQTPRTPTTAAAHYFDEVFGRSGKPAIGSRPSPFLRRSSASRSIGNRSDFEASINGGGDDDKDEDTLSTNGAAQDPQMEEDFTNYIAGQLNRVRNNATIGTCEDEFTTLA